MSANVHSPYTPHAQAFFHNHKEALRDRLGVLKPILDGLEKRKVLNSHEKEILENEKVRSKQCDSLLDMLKRKGGRAQEKFYELLKEWDPLLIDDLDEDGK